MPRSLSTALVVSVTLALAPAAVACDLRMQPSEIFGQTCNVLVGYYNGIRVGPFHISLPDGSIANAGTCEGYISVQKIAGNVIYLGAFHAVQPRTYTLADDCRSSTVK
jgi:hypothetical protein